MPVARLWTFANVPALIEVRPEKSSVRSWLPPSIVLMQFAKLKVAYGEPIPLDDLEHLPPRQAQQMATERLMERIYELHATL